MDDIISPHITQIRKDRGGYKSVQKLSSKDYMKTIITPSSKDFSKPPLHKELVNHDFLTSMRAAACGMVKEQLRSGKRHLGNKQSFTLKNPLKNLEH